MFFFSDFLLNLQYVALIVVDDDKDSFNLILNPGDVAG